MADGVLTVGSDPIRHRLTKPMAWRFEAKWRAKTDRWGECAFALSQDGKDCVRAGFGADGRLFCVSAGERRKLAGYQKDKWVEFHVEVDLQEREFNLYADGARLVYGAALADSKAAQADTFENIALKNGRNETRLEPIKVDFPKPGAYAIEYLVTAY